MSHNDHKLPGRQRVLCILCILCKGWLFPPLAGIPARRYPREPGVRATYAFSSCRVT